MTHSISCPHCRASIAINDARAGRFRIKCPTCGRPIALTIPDDPAAPPLVAAGDPSPAEPQAQPEPTVEYVPPARPAEPTTEYVPPAGDRGPIEPDFRPPRTLGGYRVGPALGPTRAGAAFRGRRWATGRAVTLTLPRPRWAADARYVARFAREATASAQLDHPNLARGLDFGVARGLPFAASDRPDDASPLSDPSRGRGGLDRSARVAAILHAARGLRHAHEQQVFHRDLTLDQILVDALGLVRVSGVGLGLTPDTPEDPLRPVVEVPGAAPTPQASPPEPAAARAAREDVAALGRALGTLLGGPRGDRAVPPGLASTARRMIGEGPEPRFPDLGAATRALEAELGVAGPFTPGDEEASGLEAAARGFDEPPLLRARSLAEPGALALLGLFVAVLLLTGKPATALGSVAFGSLVALALLAFRGVAGRDPIFDRLRELALGGPRGDLLTSAAVLALALGTLAATHLLAPWVALAVVAVALAGAYHHALDRPIAAARAEPLARARALLLVLRRRGVDEDDLRRFACRQAGPGWEEFYETLFGYDAMRQARDRWGLDAGGKARARHARWRDPIVALLGAPLEARRRDRDLALLGSIEERGLEARGINLLTARRRGRRVAEATVALAARYRDSPDRSLGLPLMTALVRAADRPDEFLAAPEVAEAAEPPAWREALAGLGRGAFGPRARFLAGVALLAGFLVWMDRNGLISAAEIRADVLAATEGREQAVANAEKLGRKLVENVQGVAGAAIPTRPLQIGPVALDGSGLGVAGLILALSAAFAGTRMALFALPGALIAAGGAHLLAGARPFGPTSLGAMALGAGCLALGILFGRTRD